MSSSSPFYLVKRHQNEIDNLLPEIRRSGLYLGAKEEHHYFAHYSPKPEEAIAEFECATFAEINTWLEENQIVHLPTPGTGNEPKYYPKKEKIPAVAAAEGSDSLGLEMEKLSLAVGGNQGIELHQEPVQISSFFPPPHSTPKGKKTQQNSLPEWTSWTKTLVERIKGDQVIINHNQTKAEERDKWMLDTQTRLGLQPEILADLLGGYDKEKKKWEPDTLLIKKSGSSWSMEDLERFLPPVGSLLWQSNDSPLADESVSRVINEVFSGYHRAASCFMSDYAPDDDNLPLLDRLENESIHRFFIDSLVVPLCRHFNLKIRAEIDIKSEDFLTNILDYTLCAGEKPVFVIEAKRWTAFSPKAVAQLVLQLCSVDRMLSGEVVVGVLTDGSHFFFVVKTPQGCYFGKEVITLRTKKDLEVLFLCFHKSLEFIRGSK